MLIRSIVVFVVLACVFGCSSLDIPATEESQRAIDELRPNLVSADSAVDGMSRTLPAGANLTLHIRNDVINRFLKAFADARSDDVRIRILPTRPLFNERKSILGIEYVNYLDLDSGEIRLNLKSLRYEGTTTNGIKTAVRIEGNGLVYATGRYTGIPAKASPKVDLVLDDFIEFEVLQQDMNSIVLKAKPKEIVLNATFRFKLLEWEIPWTQTIPLRVEELLKPVSFPVSISTSIPFPVPASSYRPEKVEYKPRTVDLFNTSLRVSEDRIEFRTDVGLHR